MAKEDHYYGHIVPAPMVVPQLTATASGSGMYLDGGKVVPEVEVEPERAILSEELNVNDNC